MVDAFFNGNFAEAMRIHRELYPFFRNIFIETNPIPIKAAMAYKGLIKEEYRLPMCPITEKNMDILINSMQKLGI